MVAHPPAGLLLPALGSAWAADRYSQKGAFFDLLGRGVSRIFSRDLRRECAVESASFLSGYLLGLPCCALAPTAETALQMLAEGNRAGCWLSREAPDRIVDRLLVWILSAAGLAEAMRRDGTLTADAEAQEMLRVVAAESAVAARELLAAARRREAALGVDPQQGGWGNAGPEDDERRLRWAYAEAVALAGRFGGVRAELEEAMVEGGVSVGACAMMVEERLRGAVDFERARQEQQLQLQLQQEQQQQQQQQQVKARPPARLPSEGASTISEMEEMVAEEERKVAELEARLAALRKADKKAGGKGAAKAAAAVDPTEPVVEALVIEEVEEC